MPNETDEQLKAFLEENAGAGFEGMDSGDFAPPFLSIVQALSPQVQPGKAGYLPDAKQGQIFSSRSGNLYNAINVIPVGYTYRVVEWKDRKKGDGGFVRAYTRMNPPNPESIKENPEDGKLYMKDTGNLLQPTMYYLVLLKEEDDAKVILSMASSQLKYARKWNNMMAAMKVPGHPDMPAAMFMYSWPLSTQIESKNQNSWFSWKIGLAQPVTELPRLMSAKEQLTIEFLPDRELKALTHVQSENKDDENVI